MVTKELSPAKELQPVSYVLCQIAIVDHLYNGRGMNNVLLAQLPLINKIASA